MCSQDANTAFGLLQRGKKTSIFAASHVTDAQTTPDLDARARQRFHCSLLKKNQINQTMKFLMCEEVPIKRGLSGLSTAQSFRPKRQAQ
jgi:hypothetical protein